ncbi:MAG: FAD-binding oxidoreductase [Acidimicrobiales bacterium]
MNKMSLQRELSDVIDPGRLTFSPHHNPDDLRDESLHSSSAEPFAVVRPNSTDEVVAVVKIAQEYGVPVTARGSGTGLSGAATSLPGAIVVSFERMNAVVQLNVNDHVVTVQPGITLRELNTAFEGTGLHYPVYPGELSGSIGGNVNTNAGGMRAVRHGVTRHHVLGLELVLANGSVIRTGGSVVKNSSGYDITQLIIGSEGTLALVTEVTLKLSPKLDHARTVLVPYGSLEEVAVVVARLITSGLQPSMLEYLDARTMNALANATSLELGVPPSIAEKCSSYLMIILETRTREQLEVDIVDLAGILDGSGALDIYVLDERSAVQLIEARERLFWVTKESGANEIVDLVVPRSTVPAFLDEVGRIAKRHEALIAGCGHVGDGNVHLSVYLPDDNKRERLMREFFVYGLKLGGQISGEHGIGRDKQAHYLALTDPALVKLQQRIKNAFDPEKLFNPYRVSDDRVNAVEG